MRAIAAAAASLFLASPVLAARPMTILDLIGAVRVADPQISPDGSRVVFVRTTTDVPTGKRNADIYVVAADGSGAPKLLIGGDKTGVGNKRFYAQMIPLAERIWQEYLDENP